MRANMSTLDYILGEEKAKSMLKIEEDAQEAKHQEAVKASIAREEEKKRKEDIKKNIESMKKRQKFFNTTWGTIETIIYLMLAVIQILMIVSQRQVTNQYFSQLGTKT